jgi:hypothetical protein
MSYNKLVKHINKSYFFKIKKLCIQYIENIKKNIFLLILILFFIFDIFNKALTVLFSMTLFTHFILNFFVFYFDFFILIYIQFFYRNLIYIKMLFDLF